MGVIDFFKKSKPGNYPKTAANRKLETEKLLKSLNIPFIDHLPLIEEENEVKIRTSQEIAERILILAYLIYVGEVPTEKEKVVDFLKSNTLWASASPDEKALFLKTELTNRESVNISWRSEAIWLLLWAINKVEKLTIPVEQVDVAEIVSRIPEFFEEPELFVKNAIIRPTTELLDISDLTYRLHWATRNADLTNKPMPANLSLSVIMERHYAINWVTYYADGWDDITTDT